MNRYIKSVTALLTAAVIITAAAVFGASAAESYTAADSAVTAETGAVGTTVTSADIVKNGIKVTWSKASGSDSTALFRRTDGDWELIKTTSDTYYTDTGAADPDTYSYTVRAVDSSGSYTGALSDTEGITVKRLSTPELSAVCAAGGVKISWKAVEGAEQYRVFVKKDGGWTAIGTTGSTEFIDSTAASGSTYTYTVRCVMSDGKTYTSYFDTAGKSVRYVAAPVITSAQCTNSGISLSWTKSDSAYSYRLYYKNSNGSWTRLADTTAASYVFKNAVEGSSYTFTVRCLDSGGSFVSSYYDDGAAVAYLSAPVISSVTNTDKGISVKWNAVSGAVKYRVYYYGSKGWTKLTDTTSTSVVDTDVSSGYTYTYTVRCINDDATAYMSGFRSGTSVYYIAAPVINAMSNTANGIKISWGAVKGAEKYRVYYYGSKGWTKLTDTVSTSVVDSDVSSGYTYTYTVRCLNSAGTAFTSYYRPGSKHTYYAAPKFSVGYAENGVKISWGSVRGVNLYRVFIKQNGSWTKLADTKETSFIDTSVTSGSSYTYTVRCMNDEGSSPLSSYLSGKSIKYIDAPKITQVSNTTEGVSVKWNAVTGAVKYRVYHRSGSSGWTKLADTTSTSYTDTKVSSGSSYDYTVRCISSAGTAFESGYYDGGSAINYIASPKKLTAVCSGNSIKISWAESKGAAKYRVYYYGSKGWTKLAETTGTSVTDTDVASGYTYRYTVRCISSDGKTFTSDFDHTGIYCPYNKVPVLNAPEYAKNGIKVSWKKTSASAKYRVYYYGSKGWTKLADTTSLSFTDTTVSSGTTRRYTVRCISSDGKSFTSDYDRGGVSLYYIAAPTLLRSSSTDNSLTFTWSKPAGAVKYRVYKKVNGSWSKLTDTTGNSYTDNSVKLGSTYTYTVRCIKSDASAFVSGFDPDGFILTVSNGSFVYYDQTKYDYPYGDGTIADSGCGPTCFAMVASTITGKTITPIDAVKWCGDEYYVYGVGTMWVYFDYAAEHFGITCESQTYSIDTAIEALKDGKYVISSHGPGLFTRGGHFIVMSGIDANGRITVHDPNGANHYVGTSFTSDEIDASATSFWIFGK